MRKIKHQKKENSDGWVMSYADLMSLLTCFFLLMYNTGEADPVRQKKIEEELLATFAPKKVDKKIIIEETTEVHRAFYILMSLIKMENQADSMIKELSKAYQDGKSKEAVKRHLEEKMPDAIQKLQKKVDEKKGETEKTVVEFVLGAPGRDSQRKDILSREELTQIRSIAGVLKYHSDLTRVEVVRYRIAESFRTLQNQREAWERSRHMLIGKILIDSGVSESVIRLSEQPEQRLSGRAKSDPSGPGNISIRVVLKDS